MALVSGVWVPIILFSTAPIIAVGVPIARAWAKRIERGAPPSMATPEIAARLERMEQAIDAIAIEVERIAEGQRFTTRLLSERAAEAPNAAQLGASGSPSVRASTP